MKTWIVKVTNKVSGAAQLTITANHVAVDEHGNLKLSNGDSPGDTVAIIVASEWRSVQVQEK